MDDPYEILGIKKTSTKREIKLAFFNLAKIYHPDKAQGDKKIAKEKFVKIHEAYETLNKNNNNDDNEKNKTNNKIFDKYFNIFLLFISEPFSKNNINVNIDYDDLIKEKKYVDALLSLKNNIFRHSQLDIIDNVYCSISDRYFDRYMYVTIKRETRDDIELYIPLRNDMNIYYCEGEIVNGIKGNIRINTTMKDNKGYYCEDGNICKIFNIRKIPKIFEYKHIDEITYNITDIIDDEYFILEGCGLIKDDNTRGDFIGKFSIVK